MWPPTPASSLESEHAEALTSCTLCESKCGLTVQVVDGRARRIRGDRSDEFSRGYLCPKGAALGRLTDDPDRVRTPLIRRDGVLVSASWTEAMAEVERLIGGVRARHDDGAMAFYGGNPAGFNFASVLFLQALAASVGGPFFYSAATVDQWPKNVACTHMFGLPWAVPVADVERTDLLVVLGADPVVSGGSLNALADWRTAIDQLQARGGQLVVADPRRSATASVADQWLAIRPGTDAHLLMGIVHTLFAESLVDVGAHAELYVVGVDQLTECAAGFTAEQVAMVCGIEPREVTELARRLAAAPRAAVYGRIGTTLNPFGTVASWLVDVVNTLTGNLDRVGGAMFALPPFRSGTTSGQPRTGPGPLCGRAHTRVRGLPEVQGQFPVAALAEEILAPGPGRIRGLVTLAGNPARSAPDSASMELALADLECLISIDMYVNETTRHADVVLPVPTPLQRPYIDVFLGQVSTRSVAKYSPAVLPPDPGMPPEWETMARVALVAQGAAPDADPEALAGSLLRTMVTAACADSHDVLSGRDPDDLLAQLRSTGRPTPECMVDHLLRSGPYGDHYGVRPDGLTLDIVAARPHGIDLGPLTPRLPEVLRTPSGMVELAPPALVADVERLRADLVARAMSSEEADDTLALVGRRTLRSMNSWLHNVPVLVKGRAACTLHLHPHDAEVRNIADGDTVTVSTALVASEAVSVRASVEVTDALRPGTVSLPHGWGHDVVGDSMQVAAGTSGANLNALTSVTDIDPLSGTAVLNGMRVRVALATN